MQENAPVPAETDQCVNLAVVQMPQPLADICATPGQGGLVDGYAKVEANRQVFLAEAGGLWRAF